MKAIISFLLISLLIATKTIAISAPNPYKLEDYSFAKYTHDFSKKYDDIEYSMRQRIFDTNLAAIKLHNAAQESLYVMNVNHMTDWTPEEKAVLISAKPKHALRSNTKLQRKHELTSRAPPFEVDYRKTTPPILTAVKNQGHCGSCWAHSAVEAMESHYAIATGRLHVLSQQQLTSCTPNPRHCGGTGGCSGSIESLAFEYVQEVGGLAEEWSYPYTSYHGETGTCRKADSIDFVVEVEGYVSLEPNDQSVLMDAVAFRGPIAVSVDASHWSMYSGGIFDGCNYAVNITQNHAVQLVGYGHDYSLKKDFWIIRNSWGPSWGENGYIRLLRETIPKCGWAVDAHSGAACDGDPDIQWVCGMCGVLFGSTYPVMRIPK